VWIYEEDSNEQDRVVFTPETLEQEKKREWAEQKRPKDQDVQDLITMGDASFVPPWELRKELGLFNAIKRTWRLSALHSTLFFHRLNADTPLNGALWYGWLLTTIGYIFWAAYRLAFMPYIIEAAEQNQSQMMDPEQLQFFTLIVLFGAPLISIISLVLNIAAYQAVLYLLGIPITRIRATTRIVVYASSPLLLLCLPLFGDLIAFVWSMVVSVTGLTRVFRLSNASSLLVVLLPPIAFYLLVLLGAHLIDGLSAAPYVLP